MKTTSRATLLRQRSHHQIELGRIDAELAALEEAGPANAPLVYSTAPGGSHPGSHRWFVERVRKHPKARRIGGKRGRGVYWEIDRADFEARLVAAPDAPISQTAPVTSIDGWLSASGYRATRSA